MRTTCTCRVHCTDDVLQQFVPFTPLFFVLETPLLVGAAMNDCLVKCCADQETAISLSRWDLILSHDAFILFRSSFNQINTRAAFIVLFWKWLMSAYCAKYSERSAKYHYQMITSLPASEVWWLIGRVASLTSSACILPPLWAHVIFNSRFYAWIQACLMLAWTSDNSIASTPTIY